MALVLAIEPDIRQGGILKRIVRELVQAELILVESRDAAIAAIDQQIPDVILLTALMSPRDEDELVTHLRRLGAAEHLQTHTIPLLLVGAGRGALGQGRPARQVPQAQQGSRGADGRLRSGGVRRRGADLPRARRRAQGRSARQRPARRATGRQHQPRRRRTAGGGSAASRDDQGHQEPQVSGSSSRHWRARRRGVRFDVVVAVRVEVQLLGEGRRSPRVSARTTAPSRRSGSASSPRRPKPSA